MTPEDDGPSPSDSSDEALFHQYSMDLLDAIDAHLAPWVFASVQRRCTEAGINFDEKLQAESKIAGELCQQEVGVELKLLLSADIDAQMSTPLTIIRAATNYATRLLDEVGVPPVARDGFDERAFPDDVYGLAPASMADIDESLMDPWITWGAAKAHVHRRRHQTDS